MVWQKKEINNFHNRAILGDIRAVNSVSSVPLLVPAISRFPICFNYESKILFYFFNSIQIIILNRQIADEGYHSSRSLHQVSPYRPYDIRESTFNPWDNLGETHLCQ